ncbi:AraC family transcriptional regulator [Acidaminobacter sp. JC074]|uniref:AraC family transcriptional regulator n=1 Tax=Acidaminobacter sp. JC074 TaxID=2530199 RepID=UPI001F0F50B9|nr:AraC family transcriptional regulator [Acidaminobacter sp. JC074]MCH4886190.1 AraC family transcriptional regulator [Acidaminobacter sp. JC074]
MKLESLINHINPVIRKIGVQNNEWPDKKRIIYDYEMLFCIKGSLQVIEDKQVHMLKRNDCLLIPPNKKHRLKLTSKDHLIIWVHFDLFSSFNQRSLDASLRNNHLDLFKKELENRVFIRNNVFKSDADLKVSFEDELAEDLTSKVLNLRQVFTDKKAFYVLESKCIFLSILTSYFKELEKSYDLIHEEDLLEVLISQYIHENIHEKISVAEIGKQVGYHPDYLNRLFKQKKACSIRTYITDYKLMTIKELLLNEEMNLQEISEMTGFSSVNYLSKFFKSHVGIRPIQYRKVNLQNSTSSKCEKTTNI